LELLTFQNASTPGTYINIKGNSSKFNFDYYGGSPHMTYFFQWVTGQSGYTNDTLIDYYAYAYVYTYPTNPNLTSEIDIYISTSSKIYLTGVKLGVLFVNKVVGLGGTAMYTYYAQNGVNFTKIFTYNMGVPSADFGQPKDGGHCLTGLNKMTLYRNSTNSTPNAFELSFSGS
jgi:hypothetical protein